MAETLRELVVALSPDSSNFSRNMRSINQRINFFTIIHSIREAIASIISYFSSIIAISDHSELNFSVSFPFLTYL